MKTLKANEITIEYTNDKEQDAKTLQLLLITNYMFFSEFLGAYPIIRIGETNESLKEQDTLEVKDLEELKELLVGFLPYYINKLQIKGDDASLTSLLRIILINKYLDADDNTLGIKKEEISLYLESIYSLIAIDYYETPEEMIKSIMDLNKDEKKKLRNYLNSKYRLNLLNELLKEQIDYLHQASTHKNQENFMVENIDELLEHTSQELLSISFERKKEVEMPSLSEQELDYLIKEFLIKIDPSLNWLKEYEKLKRTKRIKPGKEWNCAPDKGKWVINTNLTHTIEDFRCFIHEFMHYITVKNQKKDNNPIALKEFPSIYFETLGLNFLREKGYPEESTEYMLDERNEWTEENVFNLYLILGLLSTYLKDGSVNRKNETDRRIIIPNEVRAKIPEELRFFYDISDEEMNHSFDIAVAFLLVYPESIYEEQPYITGTYLADKAVEITKKDPMFIYDMLSITDNLEFTNPTDVINLIKQKHKQYVKQEN